MAQVITYVLLLFAAFSMAAFAVVILVLMKALRVVTKRGALENEARLIQELHRELSGMEARLDALETIILERERKRDHVY